MIVLGGVRETRAVRNHALHRDKPGGDGNVGELRPE